MSSINAAKEIYKLYGMKGFYRGFGPTVVRAFPAVCFNWYNYIYWIINFYNNFILFVNYYLFIIFILFKN